MVEAESEVVLLTSFFFVSMLSMYVDDPCGSATLWWLVLPED